MDIIIFLSVVGVVWYSMGLIGVFILGEQVLGPFSLRDLDLPLLGFALFGGFLLLGALGSVLLDGISKFRLVVVKDGGNCGPDCDCRTVNH